MGKTGRTLTGLLLVASLWETTILLPTLATSTSLPQADPETDVLVVGAGISGISAAIEAARGGARVTVLDMWSVFGGHAVVAGGVLSIVGTPHQAALGIQDSPQLASRDFLEFGEDANPEWVRFYVDHSRELIYDWLIELGLDFESLGSSPGNSVSRIHRTRGEGRALITAIYRESLRHPQIRYLWNQKVTRLLGTEGRLKGVEAVHLRSGRRSRFSARAVVLATGGFQSNLQMVREFWPVDLPFPDEMLVSSGFNAVGLGHSLAQQAGGKLSLMDHQWNYSTGVPDPRYPGSGRGLFARVEPAIWVTSEGKRFVNESGGTKVTFPALARLEPSRFWAIFDQKARSQLEVRGTGSDDAEEILQHPDFTGLWSAPSLEELATKIGVPAATLQQTVARYNDFVRAGRDPEFDRFDAARSPQQELSRRPFTPQTLERPPFYALLTFPITRKSMGGVLIDIRCRVLDAQNRPIAGLYAVGELTGFGGINGRAGLEGTFLGPSIVTGRVAGRAVLQELDRNPAPVPPRELSVPSPGSPGDASADAACLTCHPLPELVAGSRPGYEHFERVHRRILEKGRPCLACHAEFFPVRMTSHAFDRLAQTENCAFCH